MDEAQELVVECRTLRSASTQTRVRSVRAQLELALTLCNLAENLISAAEVHRARRLVVAIRRSTHSLHHRLPSILEHAGHGLSDIKVHLDRLDTQVAALWGRLERERIWFPARHA